LKSMNLLQEVEYLSHQYARLGGKKNRKMQRKRMIKFAKFVEKLGCKKKGSMGRKHVVLYFKSIQNFKEKTQYNHWLALCELWKLLEKTGKPPRPQIRASKSESFYDNHRPVSFKKQTQ